MLLRVRFFLSLYTLYSIFLSTFLRTSLIKKAKKKMLVCMLCVCFFLNFALFIIYYSLHANVYGLFYLKWAVDLTTAGKIVIKLLAWSFFFHLLLLLLFFHIFLFLISKCLGFFFSSYIHFRIIRLSWFLLLLLPVVCRIVTLAATVMLK